MTRGAGQRLSVEQWHRKKHTYIFRKGQDVSTESVEGCIECGRQRAICKRKRRFETEPDARDKAHQLNIELEGRRIVGTYYCRVCEGFHLTTAHGAKRKRFEKERRKTVTEAELRRRGVA